MLLKSLACVALSISLPAFANNQVMLVLDASGSMWGQIDGVTKIEIARDTVEGLVTGWNANNNLGLIAYGHNRKGDCDDIKTLIPAGKLDAKAYMRTVYTLNPKGMTPLSAAVMQGAEALKYTEQKATVILVSDGEETCKLDPCAVGKQLEAAGVDFTAHVIGFDVPNPEHQAQLRCLAENTGGKYFNARNAGELSTALDAVVAVSTEAPLPSATATLTAPDSAPVASEISVTWEGPADKGDYLAIFKADDAGGYTSYAYVDKNSKQVKLIAPANVGTYELRYISDRRKPNVLARRAIKVTEVQATLEAAGQVNSGTSVSVKATGPHAPSKTWIGIAPKGAPAETYIVYSYTQGATTEVTLKAPSEPGEYEIRYIISGAAAPIAARALTVVESDIAISGPTDVMAASPFTVTARGPEGGHWLSIAEQGADAGRYISYQYLKANMESYNLVAPNTAGNYELRVILTGPARIAASQPIRVLAPEANFNAPEQVKAGETFDFSATGPSGGSNWISIALVGSADREYKQYSYVKPEGKYTLSAPAEPGNYELRYLLAGDVVIARKPIKVGN